MSSDGGTMGQYSDEYEAYQWVTGLVKTTATQHGWTDEQLAYALVDVEEAHADALESAGYFRTAVNIFDSTPSGDLDTFWDHLRVYAQTWDGEHSDELRAAFGSAQTTTGSVAEQAEAESIIGQITGAAVQTTQDVKAAGTSRTTWIVVGVVAAAVVLVAVTGRR